MITTPFGFKARAEVKALGLADLPIQVLPHPIGQLPDEKMRAIADEAFPEVEFCLTSDPKEVSQAYETAVAPRIGYSYHPEK